MAEHKEHIIVGKDHIQFTSLTGIQFTLPKATLFLTSCLAGTGSKKPYNENHVISMLRPSWNDVRVSDKTYKEITDELLK